MKAAVVAAFLMATSLTLSGNEISKSAVTESAEHKEYIIIVEDPVLVETETEQRAEIETEIAAENATEPKTEVPITEEPEFWITFTPEEFKLFTNAVQAEGGICGEAGQRGIADVILNRLEQYGSLKKVIYAPGQFSCAWDGGLEKHSIPSANVVRICLEEMQQITFPDVYYFRNGHYHRGCGTPSFTTDGLYFSDK